MQGISQDCNGHLSWSLSYVSLAVNDTNTLNSFPAHILHLAVLSLTERQHSRLRQRGTRTNSADFYLRFGNLLGSLIYHSCRKHFLFHCNSMYSVFAIHSSGPTVESRVGGWQSWILCLPMSLHQEPKHRPSLSLLGLCALDKRVYFSSWKPGCWLNHVATSTQIICVSPSGLPGGVFSNWST